MKPTLTLLITLLSLSAMGQSKPKNKGTIKYKYYLLSATNGRQTFNATIGVNYELNNADIKQQFYNIGNDTTHFLLLAISPITKNQFKLMFKSKAHYPNNTHHEN